MSATPSPTPALPPPPGETPNFVNPETLLKWEILTICLCLISTTIVFVLRTYVRISIKRSWILEDYMCTLSWILQVFFLGLLTRLMSHYGGRHQWDLTKSQARYVLEWTNIVNCFYTPTILFVKWGILLLYRRVFVVYKGSLLDWSTQVLIFVVFGFEVAAIFIKIWKCVPREKIWDEHLSGHCVNFAGFMISSGVFNTATDIVILFLPIKAVWNLQMSTKTKFGVVSIFTIGLTAPIFSLVGMIIRVRIAASEDVTYNHPKIHLFAAAEIATGILCLCMPTLAALKPSYRAQLKRPSISILNGESNSRRTPQHRKYGLGAGGKYGRDVSTEGGTRRSADEVDLVGFEMREGGRGDVVTRIGGDGRGDGDGGKRERGEMRNEESATRFPINAEDESGEDNGTGGGVGVRHGAEEIIKTVEIEQMQTYV